MFDARVFNIPKEEVTNLIYWRQLDATRNSIQMVGQAIFSHNELQYKSCNDIQNMLLTEADINWNDYPVDLKRGSCCIKNHTVIDPYGNHKFIAIDDFWVIDHEIPIFKDEGREYIDQLVNFY
jgi:tRNA(His) 5'-end guanylyltransferase